MALVLVLALLGASSFVGCDTLSETDADARVASVSSDTPAPVLSATGAGCITGTQRSGALYELCVPEGGNPTETLVLFARGFVFPQQPLALPEDEDIRPLFLNQGFAYGTTSFNTNGLVDPKSAIQDLRGLVFIHALNHGWPERVLLFGISNGALLSTLAIEQRPWLFDGGLAVCGPIGSYVRNVDYLGDIYVVFDALFPNALDDLFGIEAGGPEGINPDFLDALFTAAASAGVSPSDFLAGYLAGPAPGVPGVLTDPANAALTQQLLTVLAATPDIAASFEAVEEGLGVVITAVVYNVFEANDLIEKTRGFAYDNVGRTYVGIDNDLVTRYSSDRRARNKLKTRYETRGRLRAPIVALHTSRDPLVPFWQEEIYAEEVRDPSLFSLREFERYGHCAFEPEEIAAGFAELLGQVRMAPAKPL